MHRVSLQTSVRAWNTSMLQSTGIFCLLCMIRYRQAQHFALHEDDLTYLARPDLCAGPSVQAMHKWNTKLAAEAAIAQYRPNSIWYHMITHMIQKESRGSSVPWLLFGGPSGHFTSSFASFSGLSRVTLKFWSFWHQQISGSSFCCRDNKQKSKQTQKYGNLFFLFNYFF